MGQAVVHLLRLFGNVDVHRQTAALCIGCQLHQCWWADRAQRVDGHAYVDTRIALGISLGMGLYGFNHARNAVGRRRESTLVFAKASGGEARAHVQRGQQGKAHAGAPGCAH